MRRGVADGFERGMNLSNSFIALGWEVAEMTAVPVPAVEQ
jgi:hypothetical protein